MPLKNSLTAELSELWEFRLPRRKYFDDYAMVNNLRGEISSWSDKYSTTIYGPKFPGDKFELQPIPDYVRWFKTGGELHYLTTEETRVITKSISSLQTTPGLFLAEKLICNLHEVVPHVADEIIREYAILCWIPVSTLKGRLEELNEKMKKDLANHTKWLTHKLFHLTVDELREKCSKLKVSAKGIKHELVERIAAAEKITIPDEVKFPSLQDIPASLAQISKLPASHMKMILFDKGLCSLGTKDEVALRLYLVKNNKVNMVAYHIRKSIGAKIEIAERIIKEELKESTTAPIRRQRKHQTAMQERSRQSKYLFLCKD